MDHSRSPTLQLRAFGPLACFTRPELKVERVSYPVITPSAARGLIEAVFWKPAIQWHIERISILAPIRFTAFRRNEVNSRASRPSTATVTSGGPAPVFYADDDRAQRNTVALRDVDYVVDAYFTMTDKVDEGENITKFVEMFRRRVSKGQHFHQPYFGCREFAANVIPTENAPPPIDDSRELGIMLYDIEYGDKNRPVFFNARLNNGVLNVPANPEATLIIASKEQGGAS